jgi:D-alanine transaminase
MSANVVYVNGAYRPLREAGVSVEDRGFQFADAIYEVWGVRDGALMDTPGHLARLHRSLGELRIAWTITDAALMAVVKETARRNRVRDGLIYLQVSRGAAPRDHAFPSPSVAPTIVVTAKRIDPATLEKRAAVGVKVITLPESRWARCDIKSVSLLPNVLAKQAARETGAFEAWYVDPSGVVTEGTSSNAWIVDADGRLRTRDLSNAILHGVTRASLLKLAEERQIPVLEQGFTVEDALSAREAFLSSATNGALSIIKIDGRVIGDGKPGPVVKLLRDAYFGAPHD